MKEFIKELKKVRVGRLLLFLSMEEDEVTVQVGDFWGYSFFFEKKTSMFSGLKFDVWTREFSGLKEVMKRSQIVALKRDQIVTMKGSQIDLRRLAIWNKLVIFERYGLVNGRRHRTDGPAWVEYYENGKVKREEYFYDDVLHREDGPAFIEYFENGSKKTEVYCINGMKVGTVEYYEDGSGRVKRRYGMFDFFGSKFVSKESKKFKVRAIEL